MGIIPGNDVNGLGLFNGNNPLNLLSQLGLDPNQLGGLLSPGGGQSGIGSGLDGSNLSPLGSQAASPSSNNTDGEMLSALLVLFEELLSQMGGNAGGQPANANSPLAQGGIPQGIGLPSGNGASDAPQNVDPNARPQHHHLHVDRDQRHLTEANQTANV